MNRIIRMLAAAARQARSVAVLAVMLGTGALALSPAHAALIQGDFATAGDGLLITDTLTGYEYLSPFATRNLSVNQVQAGHGGLLTTHGFRYAGAATVQGMIDTYFPGTTTVHPGTVAGFAVATSFMALWGQNNLMICGVVPTPCPRTQGYAIDGTTATGLGMITFGTTGYQILHSHLVSDVATFTDGQMGHWLIRDGEVVASVAEPGGLLAVGGAMVGLLSRWRRRPKAASVAA